MSWGSEEPGLTAETELRGLSLPGRDRRRTAHPGWSDMSHVAWAPGETGQHCRWARGL